MYFCSGVTAIADLLGVIHLALANVPDAAVLERVLPYECSSLYW